MEDYNSTISFLFLYNPAPGRRLSPSHNGSIDFIKPILVNDRKVTYQELKNEYSKAIGYIDSLKVDKNNLMETIKLLSNRKPEPSGLSSSASTGHLKGVVMAETDKKLIQLEQENRELRRTISEYRSREHAGNDKRVIALEQENVELKKTLEMKSDQIMTLQKEAFAQRDYSEVERLDKTNRHLKKQVELLNQDLEIITKKFQQLEEENLRIASASAIPKETVQTVIKYINYILNTINTFQPSNPIRGCFEERFTSPMEVHRLVNAKDYVALFLKCLKFISDILITTDKNTSDANPVSIRTPTVQDMMVSNILESQGIQPSVQKRKSVGINRANTPLGRSSGSFAVNTSLATNCQTPSGASAARKHVRTPSQEIAFVTNDESHILYKAQPSQSSRIQDKIVVGSPQREIILSPKAGTSLERDRRSQSGLARRTPQTTPLDTSLNSKEVYINERESEYLKLGQDLQKKKERIRDLSRELDRMENKDTVDTQASSNVVIRERKGSHKRVNTDSCIPIKDLVTEPDHSYSTSRNAQEVERSVIRLKPVLKVSTYTSKERDQDDTSASLRIKDDDVVRPGSAYLNPYGSPKEQLNDLTRKFQALEAASRPQDNNRGKSPFRESGSEHRPRIRTETSNDVSNYRDDRLEDYDRSRRPRKMEEETQRQIDDDIYQPKVLPRPQPKERLEDFAVGNTSLSKSYSRGKISVVGNIGNPYAEIAQSRVTFETESNAEGEGLFDKNSSTRNMGGFRSPININLKPKGINYASFQVAFGRTETRDILSPTPQERRALSPSIIDVPSRKRVGHVDQTYDVIRGEEKNQK